MKSREFIKQEIDAALKSNEIEKLDSAISSILDSEYVEQFIDTLNELLINPNHWRHQEITRVLQDIKSPSSIPFIRKVFENNFEHLAYTASDSNSIAKWFSWALYSIGTEEAIELIKHHSKSGDDGIREEMTYRLGKINSPS